MRQAFTAGVAALLLVLLGSAGPAQSEPAPQERKPAIILAPPPGEAAPEPPATHRSEAVEPQAAPVVEAEVPDREPPPVARKKPPPPKKVSAPRRAPKQAPAKQTPAKQAPARSATSPAPQSQNCDYCYGCESLSAICKRQWVCGQRYSELLAAGLCRR
jgi:outer membrane biosynthesis protein TonB